MIDPFSLASLSVSLITPGLKLLPKLWEFLLKEANQHILYRVIWVICVVILMAFSAAAIFGLEAAIGSYKYGITVTIILWSLFLGTTASLLLPSKVIVATFGGIVGVSLSEVGTASGLISIARRQVTELAIEVSAIANPVAQAPQGPDPFITWMIWLSVGLMALLCLPAFFEKGKQ